MLIIISDASPIHYLALIGETQILPALYTTVIIPQKVYDEITKPCHADALISMSGFPCRLLIPA
jgi:predicted nucleic acid-binding protein